MPSIPVQVQRDHIAALVTAKRPLIALAELIWNGLDADANEVSVNLDFNGVDALESIRVQDTGSGIAYGDVKTLFGNLGGSWKKLKNHTPNGRGLHGQSGKGRFKAFSLGTQVEWKTTSGDGNSLVDFTITGNLSDLQIFQVSKPIPSVSRRRGTEVTIYNIQKSFVSLYGDDATAEMAKLFAVYLTEYPHVTLRYQGVRIDPKIVQRASITYALDDVTIVNGGRKKVDLTIIEWKVAAERTLYLCDTRGIALHQIPAGIQARGYQFTGYLKSDIVKEFNQDGLIEFDGLNPGLEALTAAAKSKMKEHFRKRAAEDAASLVKEWKEEQIYPYEGDPEDSIEEAEREVFDVLAMNVSSYLKSFDESDNASKRFTFTLLKQAISENPASVQKILSDVLHLPKEKQDEFAELLEETSLISIITAAKVVTDRLNFLRGLDALVHEQEAKEALLERDQLHKVLASHTWIFGEEYHLTLNEETLDEVLEKHLDKLGKRTDDAPVVREDGKEGRIDLMLGRLIPHAQAEKHEYLVIELKRPSKNIDTEVLSQIESYAFAVAQDPRFLHTETKWNFWAISVQMSEAAERRAKQRNRPLGMTFEDGELNIQVWAKTWGQIIRDCQARLGFFRKQLNYEATRELAKSYLKKTHGKYLPKVGIGAAETEGSVPAPPLVAEFDPKLSDAADDKASHVETNAPPIADAKDDQTDQLKKPVRRKSRKGPLFE